MSKEQPVAWRIRYVGTGSGIFGRSREWEVRSHQPDQFYLESDAWEVEPLYTRSDAEILDRILSEVMKMVDPFNRPTPGSYNMGHDNGIIATVATIRDLYPRAVAGTYPFHLNPAPHAANNAPSPSVTLTTGKE